VTQLEQRYAPLRSYTPQAVQGLASFAQAIDQNPVEAWIDLAQRLQQSGAIDKDLDIEHLAALASGQDPDVGAQPNGNGVDEDANNPLVGLVQQLQSKIEQLEGNWTKTQEQQRARVEDVALERQLNWMKGQLSEGGIPEDAISREFLLSSYIAHRGNVQKAVEQAVTYRNAILKGVVPDPTVQKQKQQLDLPNGAPPTGRRSEKSKSRSMFSGIEAAAEQSIRAARQ
jgi:hypothetical protein